MTARRHRHRNLALRRRGCRGEPRVGAQVGVEASTTLAKTLISETSSTPLVGGRSTCRMRVTQLARCVALQPTVCKPWTLRP